MKEFIPKLGTVFCGDAYKILPLIPDNYFNCLITDPPYNLSSTLRCRNFSKKKNNKLYFSSIKKQNISSDYLKKTLKTMQPINLELILKEGIRICKDKIVAIYGYNNSETLFQYVSVAQKFCLKNQLNWELLFVNKKDGTPFKMWFKKNEIILLVYDKKIKKTWSNRNLKFFDQNHAVFRKGGHPFKKGIPESEWLLKALARPGGRIIDPFCGGGTLLKLAQIKGYQVFGIDQDRYWSSKTNDELQGEIIQYKKGVLF